MTSRYEAVLNGVALSSLSGNILITDIKYPKPAISYENYNVAKRHGSRIWQRKVDEASVTIDFVIREYSIAKRQEICNDVVQWAKDGGILQTNDRPGQRLRCVCSTFPYIPKALKWTDTLSVTFTAYELPFWENLTPTMVELSHSGSTAWAQTTAYVPGNIEQSLVEVTVTANAAITRLGFGLTTSRAVYSMVLDNISVASGGTVTISYDDNLIQSIMSGSTSLLSKRTGSTDLLAFCGENNLFSFYSSASATAVFKTRGLWL